MLTHVVMFKMQEGKKDERFKVRDALLSMKGKIPGLLDIEVGADIVHSERSFDVVLITRFNSLEDMKAYQVNPLHVEVAKYIATVREAVVSVDFEA